MTRLIQISLVVYLLFFSLNLFAQDTATVMNRSHSISFRTRFIQIKDEFNYGLVFNGVNLDVGYTFMKVTNKNTLSYSTDLAFGANYNKGIGVAWYFQPVDFFYGFKINESKTKPLTLGPYFSVNYKWHVYPELQSGHMFWFTSLEVGPRMMLIIPFKNKLFKISVANSLAGWTSRPVPATETTFYTLKIADFIRNAHSNMKFGSFNLFNHTNFEIELVIKKDKKLSVAYEFEYWGFYQVPEFSCLLHSLNLKWKIGKKN